MKAYYLFGKSKLPNSLSKEVDVAIRQIKLANTKEEAIQKAYKIITTKYRGRRMTTLVKIRSIFSEGTQDLWNRSGFMHCTNQNYLLAVLLVKSGFFKEEDIKLKWTMLWGISPHQYLRVMTNKNEYIDIDAWSAVYGIALGDHAHGFHTGAKLAK
jgi:hypothetical protein